MSLPLLLEVRRALDALGRFWGQIEVDINPDVDRVAVAAEETKPGTALLFDLVVSMALPLPAPGEGIGPRHDRYAGVRTIRACTASWRSSASRS